jgi:mono/diheme cytochrome c family protein
VLYCRAPNKVCYDWNMTRIRLLLMGWMCLGLGVGLFLWGWPTRSRAVGGTSRAAALTDLAAAGLDRAAVLTTTQANPTPTPLYNPTATPPSQGGHGHDIFYVYCTPCHGDVGQGLTDEFRLRAYPPEDTNCWKSGCHGERPYDNGFKLPHTVPALIGANTLTKFATARNVYDFMRSAMPFNKPGSLSQEQYLQLTAFLLEQNNLIAKGSQLDVATLSQIAVRPAATPVPLSQPSTDNSPWLGIGVVVFVALIGLIYLVRRFRSSSTSR